MFFRKQSEDGYSHPSLTQAFNDVALSPKGLAVVNHCRAIKFPLQVCTSFREKILGDCSPAKMRVLAGTGFRTIAHESRHAFQIATQGVQDNHLASPLPYHIIGRMMEADAAAFTSMVAIERWHSLGYTAPEKLPPEELKGADPGEILGLTIYDHLKKNPRWEAHLMRTLFQYHYDRLQNNTFYESKFMKTAAFMYAQIHDDLSNFKWFPFPNKKERAQIIDNFQNPEKIILPAIEKLGCVLTLDVNYLTETRPALTPPGLMKAFHPSVQELHDVWQGKISKIIADKYTPKA